MVGFGGLETFVRRFLSVRWPSQSGLDHLPTVLAREEVEHLLKAVADLKLRTALITIYSAGLRISEAINGAGYRQCAYDHLHPARQGGQPVPGRDPDEPTFGSPASR